MQRIFKDRQLVAAVLTALTVVLMMVFATGSAYASFGFVGVDGQYTAGAAGGAFTQAGGHPYAVTTQLELNHHLDPVFGTQAPDAQAKDIYSSLPAGLLGNPGAVGKCSFNELSTEAYHGGNYPDCPFISQVGVAVLHTSRYEFEVPLFNMQPPPNVAARLAFNFFGVPVVLDASVRSDGDYGLDIDSRNISEAAPLWGIALTVWGVPADPSHDGDRCQGPHLAAPTPSCPAARGEPILGPNAAGVPPAAFMRLPTRCTAPGVGLETRFRADSWNEPGVLQEASFLSHEAPFFPAAPGERGPQVGVTGCERVPFEPGVSVKPTTSAPDSPAGLDVSLSIPQESLSNPTGLTQADLKRVVVRLPEGMAVNPSSADGLGACTSAEIKLGSTEAPVCPESSKIGTVEARTPLLADPLEGSVYLAAQGDNPFGSLVAMYMVANGPGFTVKLAGHVELDASTGRLTATFDNLPQFPLGSVQMSLKSGARAPLVTPGACGASTIESTLEAWNGKTVTHATPYSVDCTPGLGGFAPSFVAGTTNNQAGAFSPFVLSFSRQDGEQAFSGIQQTLAPGLLAKLAGVPQCSNSDAAAGTCPAASQIGSVTTVAGAGPDPFSLGGKIYLTGPYNGGPFGEAVVVPVVAGPFNLGTVVVRGAIRIDSRTAQATVVSDPLPQILQGIPVALRRVDVNLDRPGFAFNPTNCEPLSIPGTLTSAQGTAVGVSSHFQAANCAALPFKPTFAVSTQGATSKTSGASLDVKVTSGAGQANLGKVAVSLPKQLPSRLSTIQQACPEAVFAANPAGCPAGSNIGVVTATTPILASAVTGPAYLVSHGGAAFPDLVMVLQGEGVTVQVTGSIDIKNGITSSAFNAVPDVPISTFEVNLPQGSHSALGTNLPKAAKSSLCGQSLTMPTTLTGQNGAVIQQSTKIAVTGCAKVKAKKKKARKHKGAHGGKKKGKK